MLAIPGQPACLSKLTTRPGLQRQKTLSASDCLPACGHSRDTQVSFLRVILPDQVTHSGDTTSHLNTAWASSCCVIRYRYQQTWKRWLLGASPHCKSWHLTTATHWKRWCVVCTTHLCVRGAQRTIVALTFWTSQDLPLEHHQLC